MKARLILIEADDVSAADVADLMGRIFERPATAAQLPEATAPAPALPTPERKPRRAWGSRRKTEPATPLASAKVKDTPERQMAPLPSTWRPPVPTRAVSGRRRSDTEPAATSLRPPIPEKFMCDQCGEDRPEGKDGRSRCPKCNARAWVKVGGKVDAVNGEDE